MADGSKPFYKKHGFWLFIGILVSAACLWYAMQDLLLNAEDRQRMFAAFREADYRTLPVIWLVLFVFYWIKAWRWAMLLAPLGKYSPLKDLFPPVMIGFALNNITPAHLGDFARVYLFAEQRKIPKTAVLSTVVLERVFDIIAILCFLCTGLLFVEGLDDSVRRYAMAFGAVSACGVLGALAYVLWTPWFVRFAEWGMNAVPILPVSIRQKIAGMMEAGAVGLASLRSWKSLTGIMFTSLAQWGLNAFLFYLAIWSFRIELESPVLVTCIVMGVVAFGVTVPSTPGYFGVIQGLFMLVLKPFTDDTAKVFGASVYYHMSQYIPVTIVGLLFLAWSGFRMKDVESVAEAEASEPQPGLVLNAGLPASGSPASNAFTPEA